MRGATAVAAVTAALILAAPVGAATVPVTSLSGVLHPSNPSVALSLDGVQFGPYADGATAVGSLIYDGLNGQTLSAIQGLGYRAMYNTTDNTPAGAPYLRVFLENNTHDIVFTPGTQPTPQATENVDNNYDVVAGTVRYDDDPGSGLDSPWSTIVAAHPNEVVSMIAVTAGGSAGVDLSVLLRDLTVNGDTFCFNCEQPGGPGPAGATGSAGPAGASGLTGATGGTGASGVTAAGATTSHATPLKLRSVRLDRAAGTVRFSMYCPKDDRLCEGNVKIRADAQTIAAKAFDQSGGAKFSLAVKLSSSARRKLAKAKKIQALVLSRDALGVATRLTSTVK